MMMMITSNALQAVKILLVRGSVHYKRYPGTAFYDFLSPSLLYFFYIFLGMAEE